MSFNVVYDVNNSTAAKWKNIKINSLVSDEITTNSLEFAGNTQSPLSKYHINNFNSQISYKGADISGGPYNFLATRVGNIVTLVFPLFSHVTATNDSTFLVEFVPPDFTPPANIACVIVMQTSAGVFAPCDAVVYPDSTIEIRTLTSNGHFPTAGGTAAMTFPYCINYRV